MTEASIDDKYLLGNGRADGSGGSDGSSGWRIVDPWRRAGYERIDLGAYLAAGWSPARGIFAAAIYERLTARSVLAWRSDVEAAQRELCVRSEFVR